MRRLAGWRLDRLALTGDKPCEIPAQMLLEAFRGIVDCGVHGRRGGASPDDPALEVDLCLGRRRHRDARVGLLDEIGPLVKRSNSLSFSRA